MNNTPLLSRNEATAQQTNQPMHRLPESFVFFQGGSEQRCLQHESWGQEWP